MAELSKYVRTQPEYKKTVNSFYRKVVNGAFEVGGVSNTTNGHLYGFVICKVNPNHLVSAETVLDAIAASGNARTGPTGNPGNLSIDLVQSKYFFLASPTQIQVTNPASIDISPMQYKSFFIDTQPITMRRMTIAGGTGYRLPYQNKDISAVQDNIYSDGYIEFQRLQSFFEYYNHLKVNKTSREKILLAWVDYRDQETFICEYIDLTKVRSKDSPLTTSYQLTIDLLLKLKFDEQPKLLPVSPVGSGFFHSARRVFASLQAARVTIDELVNRGTYYSNTVSNVVGGLTFGVINQAFLARESILLAFKNLIQSYSDFKVLSRDNKGMFWAFLKNISDLIIPKYTMEDTPPFTKHPIIDAGINLDSPLSTITPQDDDSQNALKKFKYADADLNSALFSLLSALAFQIDPAYLSSNKKLQIKDATSIFNAPDFSSYQPVTSGFVNTAPNLLYNFNKVKVVTVQDTDTIEHISLFHYDSLDQIPVIAYINNIAYPYISKDYSINTVSPGGLLILPSYDDSGVDITQFKFNYDSVNEFYGTDISLTQDSEGDFDLDITESGDIKLKSGVPNYLQAINIRLGTERGAWLPNPDFGFLPIAGDLETLQTMVDTLASVQVTMLSDPRTESISIQDLYTEGNVLRVKFTTEAKKLGFVVEGAVSIT